MRIGLPTGKLNRRSTVDAIRKAISACQQELENEYDRSGKIGNRTPEDMNEVWKVSMEECYRDARRHAGTKVPTIEKLFPKEKG